MKFLEKIVKVRMRLSVFDAFESANSLNSRGVGH